MTIVVSTAWTEELKDLKQSWKTSRPLLDRIKEQSSRYRDAVSRLNLLARSAARSKSRGKAGQDTVYVLAVKAQFQLDEDTMTTGNGHFDYQGNGQPMYVGNDWRNGHNLDYEPPHDSLYFYNQMLALRNYYLAVSGGKLWIEFEQWPKGDTAAYTLPHQMSFYSDYYNNYGENWGAGLYVLLRDAVEALAADSSILHTGSGPNKIPKAVMVFHAGSCWQTDPYGADIPSVFLQMDSTSPIIVRAGADTIYEGIIDAETQSQDGMVLGSQGEIAHEFGHQLGLPDLYDYSMYSVGLGEWELMSWGSWNMNAFVPPHLSAWCKVFLGWSQPLELKPGEDLQVAFRWVARDPDAIVKIPINSHEYYLVENRRAWVAPNSAITDSVSADSNGARVWRNGVLVKINDYDMSLPFELDTGGLLVWHVDEYLIKQRWADNSLETGEIKAIYLLEADHIQDLQRWGGSPYSTFASPYDAYYYGNNNRLDDGSDPATMANDGAHSHISVSGISAPDTVMTARVKVGWNLTGFPYRLGGTVDWNSANYALVGDTAVIVLPDNEGTLHALIAGGSGYLNSDTSLFAIVGGYVYSSPTVGDIDKDGRPEVFVSAAASLTQGAVWGYEFTAQNPAATIKTAQPIPGFPDSALTQGPTYSSPTLADINGDDTLEVIVASDDGRVYAWDHRGRRMPGFPVDLHMETRATVSAADLSQAHPGLELVVLAGDSKLHALNGQGESLPGFPTLSSYVDWMSSSTAIGDINRDGYPEIVACPKKSLCAVDRNGLMLPGWPVSFEQSAIASPALGDLDDDGYLEIAAAIGTKLYVFNYNGTLVSGYPITISDSAFVQSSPAIADLDNDGLGEVVIGSPNGRVYSFNGDGTSTVGFPLTIGGPTLSSPLIAELDGDSTDTELLIGCDDQWLYAWSIGSQFKTGSNHWPMFAGRQDHNSYLYWDLAANSVKPASTDILKNLYVYPNPARGNNAKIRFYLEKSAEITVKIFNLAGDLIREYRKQGLAMTDNEQVWTFDNTAPGLYIIVVQAWDGSSNLTKTCKAAVIK